MLCTAEKADEQPVIPQAPRCRAFTPFITLDKTTAAVFTKHAARAAGVPAPDITCVLDMFNQEHKHFAQCRMQTNLKHAAVTTVKTDGRSLRVHWDYEVDRVVLKKDGEPWDNTNYHPQTKKARPYKRLPTKPTFRDNNAVCSP